MAEVPTMKFGKHNGRPITEVPTPYLEWLTGDNDDGSPRCSSRWFYGQITSEIARRTGGGAEPPDEHRAPVRVHHDAPPGSQAWMNQPKPAIDMQRLFTALAQISSKLDDVLARLGEPVAADESDEPF